MKIGEFRDRSNSLPDRCPSVFLSRLKTHIESSIMQAKKKDPNGSFGSLCQLQDLKRNCYSLKACSMALQKTGRSSGMRLVMMLSSRIIGTSSYSAPASRSSSATLL